jgi:hypothetical protein
MVGLAPGFFAAWEQGLGASPVERGLLLLALGSPGEPYDRLARLSVGERDARLLALREHAFGSRMGGRVSCPGCAAELEIEFRVADLRADLRPEEDRHLRLRDYEIRLRPADSTDLARLTPREDRSENVRRLLARCVLSARRGGEEIPADRLPPEIVSALSERLSRIDPQADVQVACACPACAHRWRAPVDIASYLWTEVHAWGERMLRDIHALASAYGWTESEILGLSPARRQAYLDLICA